jgi:hypothetical protein
MGEPVEKPPFRAVGRLLDRLFPSRVFSRDRRQFLAEYDRATTCLTCGHSKTAHSVVQPGEPCRLRGCGCAGFVWPDRQSAPSAHSGPEAK